MPDFTRWMNWDAASNLEDWLADANRAGGVAFMLNHRGVEITLVRGSMALSPQKVLLVPASGSRSATSEEQGGAGVGGKDFFYIIGTSGHPDIADLDIKRGDLFALGTAKFEVTFVDTTMVGKVEARVESMR